MNFAKRDEVPELQTPDQQVASESQSLEKTRQKIRAEYSQYYRERTKEELKAFLTDKQHITHIWLIKEIMTTLFEVEK